jgi:DNA-directed RNA polymerase subunit RPC12/RpoP
MSVKPLACPKCGSGSVRRSRRVNRSELTKMLMGIYPFRCLECNERFWSSVWLLSVWKWAKCPHCLNVELTDWPKRHVRVMTGWEKIRMAFGAHKHRCSKCRYNFVSFLPRLSEEELVAGMWGSENAEEAGADGANRDAAHLEESSRSASQ